MPLHLEEITEFKKDWESKGAMVDAGGDGMIGDIVGLGGGASCMRENFACA